MSLFRLTNSALVDDLKIKDTKKLTVCRWIHFIKNELKLVSSK